MTWIVDTCVLLDVRLNDPQFGRTSATCLAHFLPQGLAISPITYIELAPAFRGDAALLDDFLDQVGIAHQAFPGSVEGLAPAWDTSDTIFAYAAWNRHVQARRASAGAIPRRPIADLLIAASARKFSGIITRNTAHFSEFLPLTNIMNPGESARWPG